MIDILDDYWSIDLIQIELAIEFTEKSLKTVKTFLTKKFLFVQV